MRARLKVVVAGMVAGDPHQGGATWAVLQWVLGLRRLGHDVVLVEPVDRLEERSVAYFDAVARAFGLSADAALVERGTGRSAGLPGDELRRRCAGADLLLNISGMLDEPALAEAARTRVFVDLDPAFNQLWHDVEGIDMGFDRHDRFVTVGLLLGDPECPVPTGGRRWLPTPPPVVLAHWPASPVPPSAPLTTVANFRGYGSIEWHGEHYGQKVHALRELVDLPQRVERDLVVALSIHPDERADLAALRAHGWRLADPAQVAGTPDAYRRFIASSFAEVGIAKTGYVRSRCGWFSDRSACYLASGRPVVAHDTGWSRRLPAGEGLLPFSDAAGAAAAVAAVEADPDGHGAAARRVAETALDSDRVLADLLEALR